MSDITLATLLAPVSNSGTIHREQIEYIDIGLLDADGRNFYELSGIEELAANIELFGLQQPLRVRPNPEAEGRFIIVSGHRRHAALAKLAESDKDKFGLVACIRERPDGSDALQELRLIYANSDTRKMSSADISKQAERVEALLYQLKEEGYDFPGRMRDHVAEACKVSKTKLARLKVIRENLIPAWKGLWEKNQINESLALTIARMPEEHQKLCYEHKGSYDDKHYCYYENHAKADGERLAELEKLKCPKTKEMCENRTRKWEHLQTVSPWSYETCSGKCCGECSDLGSCKKACSYFSDKIKKLREERREEKRQEKLAQEAKDLPKIRKIQELWLRFGVAREAAGKSVQQMCKAMNRYYATGDTDKEFKELEDNTAKEDPNAHLPYGNCFYLSDAENLIAAANLLGCSIDYLLCRTDIPEMAGKTTAQPTGQLVFSGWMPGGTTPSEPCDVVAVFDLGLDSMKKNLMRWNGTAFTFPGTGAKISLEPIKWMVLPPEEESL